MLSGASDERLVLEETLIPALNKAGYTVEQRARIGLDLTGHEYPVDIVASVSGGGSFPISVKWRLVSEADEETIPFEAITLAKAVRDSNGKFEQGYLVLAGSGWRLKAPMINRLLEEHLRNSEFVSIMDLESFLAAINARKL